MENKKYKQIRNMDFSKLSIKSMVSVDQALIYSKTDGFYYLMNIDGSKCSEEAQHFN